MPDLRDTVDSLTSAPTPRWTIRPTDVGAPSDAGYLTEVLTDLSAGPRRRVLVGTSMLGREDDAKNYVAAVDADTGAIAWRVSFDRVDQTPGCVFDAVTDMVACTSDGLVRVFAAADGRRVGEFDGRTTSAWPEGLLLQHNEELSVLTALDFAGRRLWTLKGSNLAAVALAEGALIVQDNGALVPVDPWTGVIDYQLKPRHPYSIGNTVVFPDGNAKGEVLDRAQLLGSSGGVSVVRLVNDQVVVGYDDAGGELWRTPDHYAGLGDAVCGDHFFAHPESTEQADLIAVATGQRVATIQSPADLLCGRTSYLGLIPIRNLIEVRSLTDRALVWSTDAVALPLAIGAVAGGIMVEALDAESGDHPHVVTFLA